MFALSLTALLACSLSAPAQTSPTTPTTPTGTFIGTVQSYFASFNTNLDSTFGSERGSLWTSFDSIQGGDVPLANSIGLSYDIYPSAPTNGLRSTALALENVLRTSGVAGTVVSDQAGVSFSWMIHDVKLSAYADAGYGFAESDKKFFGEIGMRALKALTPHTYAGVSLGVQLPGNRQVLGVLAGFTF